MRNVGRASAAVPTCPSTGASTRARALQVPRLRQGLQLQGSPADPPERPHRKPQACEVCGRGFTLRSALAQHWQTMQETRPMCVTHVAGVSAREPTSTCTSMSILGRDHSGVRPVGSSSAGARIWASTRGSTQESSPRGVGLVRGASGTIQPSGDTRGCTQGRSPVSVPCVGRGFSQSPPADAPEGAL